MLHITKSIILSATIDSVSAAQFSCVPRLFTARFFGRMDGWDLVGVVGETISWLLDPRGCGTTMGNPYTHLVGSPHGQRTCW